MSNNLKTSLEGQPVAERDNVQPRKSYSKPDLVFWGDLRAQTMGPSAGEETDSTMGTAFGSVWRPD